MAQNLATIKINFAYTGVNPASNTVLANQQLMVELPGVGNSAYERSLFTPFNAANITQDDLTRRLDPRYAPFYHTGIDTTVTDRAYSPAYTRLESDSLRSLTTTEISGDVELKLSNSPNDANNPGFINFRAGDSNNLFYVPPGVHLSTGDEFYRIRFYQKLLNPVGNAALVQESILIAAEAMIVYNPTDTDSWSSGTSPNRLLHANVRHIQWQGYSYKTPMTDPASLYMPVDKTVVHTSFQIQSIALDDLSQIHEKDGGPPTLVITIQGSDLPEDTALANTLITAANAYALQHQIPNRPSPPRPPSGGSSE